MFYGAGSMLRIYNTLSRAKDVFTPLVQGKAGLYVCGMTVYDYCHVGHARVLVVFDIVVRYLRYLGYDVTYVRNITDIDDKIIARALENGETISALTERFIAAMHEDADALAVLRPDMEPRATASMPQIVAMIQRLVDKGAAYQAENGDVYYDVSDFDAYGALSGKQLEDLRAGERVDVDNAKDDPLDFVLWKSAKPEEPEDAKWDSPWGVGRPGWHIECSAMSTDCLGDQFDIHGGGMDLMFPHHENEIAQSEVATGCRFVNTWMHNGFVNIDNEKMSKSLGNFFTVREVLKKYDPEVVRYFILTSQYRSPLNYSDKSLDNAKQALERFYTALRGLDAEHTLEQDDYLKQFQVAMDDDFNTPEALAVLFELVRELNKVRDVDQQQAMILAGQLKALGGLLGILQHDPDGFLRGGDDNDDAAIDALIAQRNTARANKDWAESDRIRDELDAMGIILEDAAGKTSWRRK